MAVGPSPVKGWRPPAGTSEEERQTLVRGYTIWKTRFDSKDKLLLYLLQFEMVTVANHWTPYESARHLLNNSAEDALHILAHLPQTPPMQR